MPANESERGSKFAWPSDAMTSGADFLRKIQGNMIKKPTNRENLFGEKESKIFPQNFLLFLYIVYLKINNKKDV